jgi:integrase
LFEAAIKTFFATYETKNRISTRKEHQRLLDKHWLPIFGKRPLTTIKTGAIVAVLDDMMDTPSEANHAFIILRTFFNWARKRKLVKSSPVDGLDKPAPEGERTRVLTSDELRAIWQATLDVGGHYGSLTRLLMITAQRRGQLTHLRGDMLAREKQVITWPPELMKMNREHLLPYGPMAAEIFSTLPEFGLLFPTNAGTPDKNSGNYKTKLDAVCAVPDWTYHDFRRTFATVSAEELGTEPHIIEAVLAHTSGTKVSRIYNRARYIEPMRKAMVAFEDWLQALLSDVKIADHAA